MAKKLKLTYSIEFFGKKMLEFEAENDRHAEAILLDIIAEGVKVAGHPYKYRKRRVRRCG